MVTYGPVLCLSAIKILHGCIDVFLSELLDCSVYQKFVLMELLHVV